jgi:predicted nucleotidyltransferase
MTRNIGQRQVNKFYEQKYLSDVKRLVLKELKKYSCNVFLFGSRAKGTFGFGSDIDIGISGLDENLFNKLKSRIILKLEESIVPFDVDIINFDTVDKEFDKETEKNRIQWK